MVRRLRTEKPALDSGARPRHHAHAVTDPVQYCWSSLPTGRPAGVAVRFALPAGFVDESILRFRHGDSVSVTVAVDACGGAIDAYARDQEAQFRNQRFAGYEAEGPRIVDSVLCVDRVFDDGTGTGTGAGTVTQRQAFVSGGKGAVVIVTASARAANKSRAQEAVMAIMQSLAVGTSTG